MEESYKCRFCVKSFTNGRALGGHMRSHSHSHMPSLDHKFGVFEDEDEERPSQLSYETESDVSSEEEEEDDDHPKFGSVLEEDGESETNVVVNLTRKRSKRTRKLESFGNSKKTKPSQLGYNNNPESWNESEAASDTTTEEDLAFCLMMLSRDKWKKKKKDKTNQEEIETEEEQEEEDYDDKSSKIFNRIKGKYKCETCGKVFKSYQALGGHRASHKKNRVCNNNKTESKTEHEDRNVVAEKRIHECPICLRVFASGQALGGHKRSHGIGNLSVNRVNRIESVMMKQRMIDLNLPAPNEEDEVVSSSMLLFQ